jgi:hypothetical protein
VHTQPQHVLSHAIVINTNRLHGYDTSCRLVTKQQSRVQSEFQNWFAVSTILPIPTIGATAPYNDLNLRATLPCGRCGLSYGSRRGCLRLAIATCERVLPLHLQRAAQALQLFLLGPQRLCLLLPFLSLQEQRCLSFDIVNVWLDSTQELRYKRPVPKSPRKSPAIKISHVGCCKCTSF